jgi:phage-related protein
MSAKCGALRHGKEECKRPVSQMVCFIPLCKSHLEALRTEFKWERNRGYLEAKTIFIDQQILEARRIKDTAVVYFIKAGHRVKIGQSRDPQSRLLSIRGGYSTKKPAGLNTSNAKLLATEPGGQAREQELHQKFAHLRAAGEWFNHTPELKAYIAENASAA